MANACRQLNFQETKPIYLRAALDAAGLAGWRLRLCDWGRRAAFFKLLQGKEAEMDDVA